MRKPNKPKRARPYFGRPAKKRTKPFSFRGFVFEPRERPVVLGNKVFAFSSWGLPKGGADFGLRQCVEGSGKTMFLAMARHIPLSPEVRLPGVRGKAWHIEAGVVDARLEAHKGEIFPWLVKQLTMAARKAGVRFLVAEPFLPKPKNKWADWAGFKKVEANGKTFFVKKL